MKAKDLLKTQNYPSIMIYGPAGTGKTGLVSQAHNSYMLDFDGGMRTAAILDDKFTKLRQECEFDTYIDANPFAPTAWLRAEKRLEEIQKQSQNGTLPYKCIIIDSLTGLVRCMQLHVMSTTGNSFNQPQIQHWGMMVAAVEKVLTLLRSTKCLFVVTAHESSISVDSINLIRPLSVTKDHSHNKIAWLFDEVLHTKLQAAGQGKHKYIVSGSSTSSIMARTRSRMTQDVNHGDVGFAGILEMMEYKQ